MKGLHVIHLNHRIAMNVVIEDLEALEMKEVHNNASSGIEDSVEMAITVPSFTLKPADSKNNVETLPVNSFTVSPPLF